MLRTAACNEGSVTLPFLEGTQPLLFCEVHGNNRGREIGIGTIETTTMFIDVSSVIRGLSLPELDQEFMREIQAEQRASNLNRPGATATTSRFNPPPPPVMFPSNPILDDYRSPAPAPLIQAEIPVQAAPPETEQEAEPEESLNTNFDAPLEPPQFNPLLD